MILRLLAFVFFVLALASLGGDAWHAYASGDPFVLRSAEQWWTATSPSTLNLAQGALPAIANVLTYPAPAVLGAVAALSLLPTAFFRQRH